MNASEVLDQQRHADTRFGYRRNTMKQVIVRYRVKPDAAEMNTKLVEAVYAELKEKKPSGIRYATFCADDGVTFYHVASIETADGVNPLGKIDAFATFQKDIGERCDEPPTPTDVSEIGSYGFFGR